MCMTNNQSFNPSFKTQLFQIIFLTYSNCKYAILDVSSYLQFIIFTIILEYIVYTKVVTAKDYSITSNPTFLSFSEMEGTEVYHHTLDNMQKVYRSNCTHPLSMPTGLGYIRMETYRVPRDGLYYYYLFIKFIFLIRMHYKHHFIKVIISSSSK